MYLDKYVGITGTIHCLSGVRIGGNNNVIEIGTIATETALIVSSAIRSVSGDAPTCPSSSAPSFVSRRPGRRFRSLSRS